MKFGFIKGSDFLIIHSACFQHEPPWHSMDAIQATLDMADAQAKMGLMDEAVSELRKAVRVHPRNLQIHEKLGVFLAKKERYEAALPHLQRVLRKKGERGDLVMLAGDCAYSTGRNKEAAKWFERCISMSHMPEKAVANLGRAMIGRRKTQQAWDRLHEAFIASESTSKEIHNVLEMCAPLIGATVPAMANPEWVEESSGISMIGAASGSMEEMAGIMSEELIVDKANSEFDIFSDDDDEKTEPSLKIALPGSGLDSQEARASWGVDQEVVIEFEDIQPIASAIQGSWIEGDHWDSIPKAKIAEPETEPEHEPEFELEREQITGPEPEVGQAADSAENAGLLFGVGEAVLLKSEQEPEQITGPEPEVGQAADSAENAELLSGVGETPPPKSEQEELMEVRTMIHRLEMPTSGSPVVASEGNALSQLARMQNPPTVWCWTTSYGEVPWGLELLKSHPSDRLEAAKAELEEWNKQNPGVWLAIDMQAKNRVPVNMEGLVQVISNVNTPIIILVPDDEVKCIWPRWGLE
jgi:tetratricopeptide (TPR) repeat protein